jgi:bifunctional DNase/RNase
MTSSANLLGAAGRRVAALQHRDRVITVDCRPSDGIAMAVRLGVPIVAADKLEPILATV